MKLASLKHGRDGRLVVVARDHRHWTPAWDVAPTLQAALDDWAVQAPRLRERYAELNAGLIADARVLDWAQFGPPLPRAYQWCDGSTYLSHMERSRAARGAALPPGHLTDMLFYQSGSDRFLAHDEPIPAMDPDWGLDLEGTLAAILTDVPRGTGTADAAGHVALLTLANDLTLRNLLPAEFAKGVGLYACKPARPLAPLAVSPDVFGAAWCNAKLTLTLECRRNDDVIGRLDTGADMQFSFADLIAHAARTRILGAGSIIGSGTVSNRDVTRGFACIAEQRAVEMLEHGAPRSPWLRPGDRVRLEAVDAAGQSAFGAIDQVVAR